MDIQYPDTLVEMWKFSHNIQGNDFSPECFCLAFETLRNMLIGYFKKNEIPGHFCEQDWQDSASDYLISLLTGVCPCTLTSYSYLIASAKKYLAQKCNPVQYEMNEILQEALLALEKEGKILRDQASQKHRISNRSLFTLYKRKDARMADMDDYKANQATVPVFSIKLRGGDAARTRMLAPADAKNLVLALLEAFGGWTRKTDLLTAMKNHIPEQLQQIPLSPLAEEDAGNNPIDVLPDPTADDFPYQDEFQKEQIALIARQTSERIWKRICAVSDKVFCLYFLPKNYFATKADLKSLGKTSTVSDQNSKIQDIFRDETEEYADYSERSTLEYIGILATLRKIITLLHGRCTECGYNPDLSSHEVIL